MSGFLSLPQSNRPESILPNYCYIERDGRSHGGLQVEFARVMISYKSIEVHLEFLKF